MSNQIKALSHSENIIWRDAGDGIVIITPHDGKVRVLNGVGSKVWELINGELTENEIVEAISNKYQAPVDTVSKDVTDFLSQMRDLSLIS